MIQTNCKFSSSDAFQNVIGTPGVMYEIIIVAGMSFMAALAALVLMMKLLQSVSYTPYVVYRVILGVILLWIAYS